MFDSQRAEFLLKRSALVTWDEARSRNLIFIGSAAENGSLKLLPSTQDFTLTATTDAAGIVNHHPLPGEPPVYLRPEHPLTKDYAVVALLPGVQPDHKMFVFSGLTTLGTQAAVEYALDPDTVAELIRRVTIDKKVHNFEALLEVSIRGGVPLQPGWFRFGSTSGLHGFEFFTKFLCLCFIERPRRSSLVTHCQ